MKKVIVLAVALCISSNLFAATYGGGNGTQANPYQIWTPQQMNTIGANPADWSKYFKLMADIDMSIYTGTQYKMIGNSTTKFTGTFDGDGHIISNLSYTTTAVVNYIGLFSRINNATIQNLGVENVSLSSGGGYIGGLVGYNEGFSMLTSCYITGSVSGTGNFIGGLMGYSKTGALTFCYALGSVNGNTAVGGLVGSNNSDGTITACYATGSVSGSSGVGGLVGTNDGMLTGCYATGSVSGSEAGGLVGSNVALITACYATGSVIGTSYVGGLVGNNSTYNADGRMVDCFWDKQTSGRSNGVGIGDPGGVTGKTTIQMQMLATFTSAGWDFVGESANGLNDYWQMEGNNYPRLMLHMWTLGGEGTFANPYIVSNEADLGRVWLRPSACYRLSGNLDLTGILWSSAVVPVFEGDFDGQGFVISHFTINRPDSDNIGLFGSVYSNGEIRNLGVENVNIAGRDYIGGLVGSSYGTLTACYVTGSASGTSSVGGLVGQNSSGSLVTCYATSSVNGYSSLGGLVGRNSSGSVTNCYATGLISGTGAAGGLVGYNDSGAIASCYASGSVNGESNLGGLAGSNHFGTLTACYATGSVSGNSQVGGLMGGNAGTLTACYATGSVSGNSKVGGLIGTNSIGSNDFIVAACFWDKQTSGQSVGFGLSDGTSLGITGKTTAEMKTLVTFTNAGWDFVNTWWMPNGDYPHLSSFSLALYIQTSPSFVASVSPSVGRHTVFGAVNISAGSFSQCPDVYKFDHWEGSVAAPNSANTTVSMTGNKTVTAVFTLATPECGDECHPNFTVGDLNHDCIIDIADFAILSSRWMNCTKPECD